MRPKLQKQTPTSLLGATLIGMATFLLVMRAEKKQKALERDLMATAIMLHYK